MAVYEFYIRNYRDASGNVITNETLIQTIPLQNEPVLINPRVKTDLGKAGSFEFSMERNSPYYDTLLQMKTIMRVTFYGETIFRGRVLTIDRNMAGTRTIHCEGDLAFLLDSHQEGVKDDDRPYTGLLNYMTDVLQQHNSDVHDPQKVFVWGEVPLGYSSAEADQRLILPEEKLWQQFGSSSWDTTMDRLESLLGEFGGYFRTRYVPSTGVTYIDWYDNYFRGYTGQKIEVTKNLIDISGPTEVENLFTVVIPIGKKDRKKNSKTNKDDNSLYITNYWSSVDENHDAVNYMTVEDIVGLYTDAELNTGYHRKSDYQNAISRFGYIWKVVDFENADTEEKLFNYCKDYIRQNFMPELTQWSVTALDMKFVGGGERAILTGDRVALTHPEVDHRFDSITVISAEYDCTNPERNKYTIGVPNQQINASYGVKKKNGGSSKKSSKAASAGITEEKTASDAKKEANSAAEDIARIRETLRNQYSMKTDWHQDISLDDPFAFLTYRDDGVTAIPLADSTREFSKVTRDLANTRKMAPLNAELVAEAKKRGVSINDPQLLIDFTESAAKAQNKFKADTTRNMLSYGLDPVMIDVLLNTSASTSTGASLVDDDGNWTQKALNQGAANWDPKVKQMAINTRNILQGKTTDTTAFGSVVSWFKDTVWGAGAKLADTLNVGDGFSFTNDGKQLNVGDMITTGVDAAGKKVTELMGGVVKLTDTKVTETVNNVVTKITNGLGIKIGDPSASTGTINVNTTVTKTNPDTASEVTKKDITFTIQNDKVNIDGTTGTASVGKKPDGSWQVKLNDTFTWEDDKHITHTLTGLVTAEDFKIGPHVNSLYAKLLAADALIANKITANTVISTAAQIEDLVGQKASITDLESATGRITTLEGDVADIKKITANSVTANTFVSAANGKFTNVDVTGNVTIDGELKIPSGDEGVYSYVKSAYSAASGSFNNGIFKVTLNRLSGANPTDLNFDVTQTNWYADVVLGAQNAGIASAKISKWNDLTKSIRYENGKLKLTHHVEAIRKDTVPNENDEYDDVTIGTVSGVSNPNDFALEITDTHGSGLAYDTGWSDAFGKVSLPDKQPTGTWPSSISIGTPKSTWNTQADSTTYSLEVGSWDTLNNTVYVNLFNNTSQKNVARKQVNASTIVNAAVTTATENGRKAGWTAAYGKVNLPSAQNNTGSMVVKTPAETEGTTPNPVSTTYTLEQDDKWGSNNKKYVYIQNGTSEKNVARLQVDASKPVSDAKAAVTLSEEWKSYTGNSMPAVRTYEVSNSANANVITKTLTISDRGIAWTNNKKYVYLIDGTTSNGTNEARFEVDASTIVNKAATNATNAANAAVTLTGSWSNGKYTVTNSANDKKASTKLENIALNGSLSSSNGKLYAPLKVNVLDDNEDEVAVFTQNSLQLGSVSWTNKTIANSSGSSSVEAEVSIGNVVLTHRYAGTYAAADSDNETVRANGWAAALAALEDNNPPASGTLDFGDSRTVTVYQKSRESDTSLTTYLTRTYTAPAKPTINAPILNTGTINYTTKSVQGGTQFYVQAPIKVTTSVANLGSTGTVDVPIGATVDNATITYDATTGKPTVTANVKVAGVSNAYLATKVFEGAAPTATLSAGTIAEKSGKLPILAKIGNVQIGSNEFAITMSGSDIGNFTDMNTQKQTTIQAKYGNYVLAEKVVTAKFTGEPYPILTPKYYENALSAKMKIDAALNSKSDGTGTAYTNTASKTIELSGSAVTLAAKTGSATIVAKVDGTTYAEQSVSITAPNPVISVNTNSITEKSNKLPVSASLGATTGLGSTNLEFTVSGGTSATDNKVQFKYGEKIISEKEVSIGGSLAELTIPDKDDTVHPLRVDDGKLLCNPLYRMSTENTASYWADISIGDVSITGGGSIGQFGGEKTIVASVGGVEIGRTTVNATYEAAKTVTVMQPFLDAFGKAGLRAVGSGAMEVTKNTSTRPYYYPRIVVYSGSTITHDITFDANKVLVNANIGAPSTSITTNGFHSASEFGFDYLTGVDVAVTGTGAPSLIYQKLARTDTMFQTFVPNANPYTIPSDWTRFAVILNGNSQIFTISSAINTDPVGNDNAEQGEIEQVYLVSSLTGPLNGQSTTISYRDPHTGNTTTSTGYWYKANAPISSYSATIN